MSTSVTPYLCDGNVADAIAATPGALEVVRGLVSSGRVELLMLPTQCDEVARIPDDRQEHRLRLLNLPFRRYGAAVFVLDESRLDIGDRVASEESAAVFERVRNRSSRFTRDAMMIATAAVDGLTLVTDDRKCAKRAGGEGITVLTSRELIDEMHTMADRT